MGSGLADSNPATPTQNMSDRVIEESSSCEEEISESEDDDTTEEESDYSEEYEQSEPDKTEDSANKANKANTTPSKENRKITNDIVNTNNKGKPQKKETASGRPKVEPLLLSQKYPRGFSLSKKTPSRGSSRVSSGSTSISLASRTGMLGSSRTESLMSSVGIVSQRKKTSHMQ